MIFRSVFDVSTSKKARLIRPVVSTVPAPSSTSLSPSPALPVLPTHGTSGGRNLGTLVTRVHSIQYERQT